MIIVSDPATAPGAEGRAGLALEGLPLCHIIY